MRPTDQSRCLSDVQVERDSVASPHVLPHRRSHVTVRELQEAAVNGACKPSAKVGSPLVRVLSGHAGAGASTLAAALADSRDASMSIESAGRLAAVRLIDAASPPWSGLAGASDRDMAVRGGWCRGSRGHRVVVDRLHAAVGGPGGVPEPLTNPRDSEVVLTVVDVGWSVRELLGTPSAWLIATGADLTVLVTRSTASGFAQTEHALRQLDLGPVAVAVVGGRRRARTSLTGTRHLRRLDDAGAVISVPLLPSRLVREITPASSPTPLRMAAQSLLASFATRTGGGQLNRDRHNTALALAGPASGQEES